MKSGNLKEKEEDFIEIDFTPPWSRVSMISELEKCLGEKIPGALESEEAHVFLES